MVDPGARQCAFCGSAGPLTREHVLGNWLSKIGLGDGPVENHAGPLNRLSVPMGVGAPFQQEVKSVCASCNNGWMGSLEETAQRVLTPLILGERGVIAVEDQPVIAMWVQKTALVSMLVSSARAREDGYGLPPSEFALLYARRAALEPLPSSIFWAGRYNGDLQLGSIWVTPLAVEVRGLLESELPHGYAMTISLGALVMHGLRFTHLPLEVDVAAPPLETMWPAGYDMELSDGGLGNEEFLQLARGRSFKTSEPDVSLRPWRPATELDASELVGSIVSLPLLCGKHVDHYPADLVYEAQRGRYYWFMTSCECGMAYLIRTESDGAHVKAAEPAELIAERYGELEGAEYKIQGEAGAFTVKEART
ncbi:hypothetical protein ITJ66_16840 [Plantibacter sp. VKM Ac-2885]|nr:hypothetical protein [Plantibacter sp. VKM Ac-2885]